MQPSVAALRPRLLDQNAGMITLLLIVDSLHFVFARLLLPYISPDISALYVQGVSTLIFGLYALGTGQLNWRILRHHGWFFLAIGALIGISTNLSYSAIAFIDPGTASMLAKVATVFSLAFGFFWLGERLTGRQWFGALVSIVGSFIVAYQPEADLLRFGALLLLASTVLYTLHTAIVKRYSEGIDFVNFFFFRVLATTVVLLLVAAGQGVLTWPQPDAWLIVTVTALVDVVISRVLYYVALRRFNMSIHTILLTLSPVVTIVWAFFLFETLPGLQETIGGITVLLGVLLVTWPRR
jgi:drug/metabolite transporter (DMT)-like permease